MTRSRQKSVQMPERVHLGRDLALDKLVTAFRREDDLLPNCHIPRDPLLEKPSACYEFLMRNEGCLWSQHPRILSLEIEQWKWEEHFNSTEDVVNRCGPVDPKIGYSLKEASRKVHKMHRERGSR